MENNYEGILYLVPVPIGNPEDISLRALRILKDADLLACEDTRKSGILLKKLEIKNQLTSYHAYNRIKKLPELLERLKNGEKIAIITDGGTPGISDPGADIVRSCHSEGIKVIPLSGASALSMAMSVSGFTSNGLYFAGFLSPKKGKRRNMLAKAAVNANTVICYESPHRIRRLMEDIHSELGDVDVVICREMTKIHEEYLYGSVKSLLETKFTEKGEFTIVINCRKKG